MAIVRTLTSISSLVQGNVFERVLGNFPKGIQMAFAYGSGVFQQTGVDMSKNMIDFIVVVDHPQRWHTENLAMNRKHYSCLKWLGPRKITNIQRNYGAGIYYNTLVPFEQRLIKYGVISTEALISDLTNWDTLYVSGRLHKPVKMVKKPTSSKVISSLHLNLRSALHSSLLLLPETFTEIELYAAITSLSYSGDFRMTFGEEKGKVMKIVTPNLEHFRKLYEPVIAETKHLAYNAKLGKYVHFQNEATRFYHLNLLSRGVVEGLLNAKQAKDPYIYPDSEEFIRKMAQDGHCSDYVSESIAGIVKKSSWSQSIKGIWTAGLRKSIKYSSKKVIKMIKGMVSKK